MSGLNLVVPEDEVEFVKEAVEAALEESREALSRHVGEEPPDSDSQSTSDGAESFIRLYETGKARIVALEHVYEQLRR